MTEQLTGPDPFLRQTPIELHSIYYPLGFPLQLKTNSRRLLRAAERSWGGRPRAFDKPAFELRAIVEPGGEHPRDPVYRGQAHLMSIVSDSGNFAVCDYTRNFAFCRLNSAAADDGAFTAYYFLEAIANFSLAQLYLAPVHGACVARNGRGVLLCGASGAGKTSLAYFCAARGWTYVSDNESWIVRGSDRLLVGNPQSIRFRQSAADLFPELRGMPAAPHANGKMSIVVDPKSLGVRETAWQCEVERVVFLAREPESASSLCAVPGEVALARFMADLPVYEDCVRKEQRKALARIAGLNAVEMRYGSLESGCKQLESLLP
jgi:hypothetical protein